MPIKPSSDDECEKFLIQQHAEDVVDFSSQYGSVDSISYTAHNLTGASRVFPAYGDHAEAFSMRTYGKWWVEAPSGRRKISGQTCTKIQSQDFVDLSFEYKVYPKSISLCEVYNPGALVRIWAKDSNHKWHLLYEADHLESPPLESRRFSPPLRECQFQTSFLRLEFNHEHLDSYYEIESVILEGFTRRYKNSNPLGELTRRVMDLDLKCLLSSIDSNSTSTSSSCSSPINTESEDEYELNCFDILPYEVVHKIFSYLDLKSLSRCCCVSKRFESVAKDPSLYVELNLKSDWPIVNEAALQSLAFRCSRLSALDMSWCNGKKDFELPFIQFISQCGSSLIILRLDCCKFISTNCLSEIAETCHQLEELSLRKILQPYQSLTGWHVLSAMTSLKYLDLYHVTINTNDLMSFLPNLKNLEHINLGSCAASRRNLLNMDIVAECLSKHNSLLKSVDMWRSHLSLSTLGIKYLAKCSRLQEVDLGWVEIEVLGDCIQELAKGCPQLKKLFVPAMRGLTDRDVHTIINNCPLLEQVDVLGIRNISPEACLRLLTQCRNLRLLDVSYCDKISRSHVALWRVQFPHVSVKQCTYSRPDAMDNFM